MGPVAGPDQKQMAASLDELVSMAVFARVVEAKTFTAAADKLGVSTSVISAKVSELEARLGVRLLHRTTRRLSLTAEGERLYERCSRLLEAADQAIDVVGDVGVRPEGLVRVTAPVGFGLHTLSAMIPDFLRRYPAMKMDVSLSDRQVDIIADGFDVAVRFAGQLRDSSLVARRIGVDHWVFCASPAYLAARGTPGRPEELVAHDCLQLSPVGERAFGGLRGPALSGSLVADNVVVLRNALLAGVGLAAMPHSVVARDLAQGSLVAVLPDVQRAEMGVFAICAHRRHQPARVRVFVEFLAERLSAPDWMLSA
jgi:DNA-binding transcriptional LysR family regulator